MGPSAPHDERALLVGVALADDLLIAREGAAVASWPGQPVMGCEQLVDVACDPNPGVDEHDEVVTDPLQVGDEVGGEDDARAVLGDHLHQALKKLAPGKGIEARDRLVEHE